MYERAGIYLRGQDDTGGSQFYIEQAASLYEDWGARGKVEQLMAQYTFLAKTGGDGASNNHVSSSLKGRQRYEKGLAESLRHFEVRA